MFGPRKPLGMEAAAGRRLAKTLGWPHVVAPEVMGMLAAGTRDSATLDIVLVVVKLVALAVFVAFAMPAFDGGNLHPFTPYDFGSTGIDGAKRGVMAAAAIVFFAFYGFDAVATPAEEACNPGRDLTIGIVGSMLVCTVIYMGVAVAAVGAVPFRALANSPEPLALVLRSLGQPTAAYLIALAAVIALPSIILVMMYGQRRTFFVMARDGLLPRWLSKVSARSSAPTRIALITGVAIAIVAGLVRLDKIAELANAGTLIAFIAVGASLIVLRRRVPDAQRRFRCPAPNVVGAAMILGCFYFFASLPLSTLFWCVVWNAIGLIVYFAYSRRGRLLRSSSTV